MSLLPDCLFYLPKEVFILTGELLMFKFKLLLSAALVACAFSAQARDIYVGCGSSASDKNVIGTDTVPNKNTRSTPYETTRAANDAALPGDVITLVGKNCTFSSIYITTSGAAGKPITWTSDPADQPTVTVDVDDWIAIRAWGSYLRVTGMKVIGRNNQINLADAARDVELLDPNKRFDPVTNPRRLKTPVNPLFNQTGIGTIHIRESTDTYYSHHVEIDNNEVRDFSCNGISAVGDYFTVRDNRVSNTSLYSGLACSGISTLTVRNFDLKPGYHNKIINNKVWNNRQLVNSYTATPLNSSPNAWDGHGIIIDHDMTPGGYKGRSLVANNIVVNNGNAGINIFKQRHVDVFNNTAYRNNTLYKTAAGIQAMSSTDVRLMNNIVWTTPGNSLTSSSNNTSSVVYDYNLFVVDGAPPYSWSPYYILRNQPYPLTSGRPLAKGANDVVVNPAAQNFSLFNNAMLDLGNPAADFRIKIGSAAIDKGVILAGYTPTSDFRNYSRAQGKGIDIGAYEFPQGAFTGTSVPVITAPTFVKIVQNDNVNFKIAFTGATQFSWAPTPNEDGTATPAVPGLTISNDGTVQGFVSATKLASYVMTVTARDNANHTTKFRIVFSVDPLKVNAPDTYTVRNGSPVFLQTSGSNNPTKFAATGLPAGLSINASTGAITGSPTETKAAMNKAIVTVTNAAGNASKDIEFFVNP
jgi:Putative Ig domain